METTTVKSPDPARSDCTPAITKLKHAPTTQELVAASSVLVIGGGLVGVELAAEIAVALPHIAVSLVHPRADLCQELPPPAPSAGPPQPQGLPVMHGAPTSSGAPLPPLGPPSAGQPLPPVAAPYANGDSHHVLAPPE